MFSLNFPLCQGSHSRLRVPLAAVEKKHVAEGETYKDIMDIICWSFRMLAIGANPTRRHDAAEWQAADHKRRAVANKPLGYKAFLCQVRGDWAFFRGTFDFPACNKKDGCCWLCRATPETLRETGLNATWRSARLTHEMLLARLAEQGRQPSPLFHLPGVTNQTFKPDWLHTLDLGVGSDGVANIFWVLLPKLGAGSRKGNVQALWARLQAWYGSNPVDTRYRQLTPTMIKQPNKPPSMAGKAAMLRGVVPFAAQLCEELLDPSDLMEDTVLAFARELHALYRGIAGDFDPAVMATASRRLATLYVALDETTPPPLWRVKPKLHLMQELCEHIAPVDGNPRSYWTYTDESFGGLMAEVARKRGGRLEPASAPHRLLKRFCGANRVPQVTSNSCQAVL